MLRVFAVLCLMAATAFGIMEKGVRVTFGLDPTKIGTSIFTHMPETTQEATNNGWIQRCRPPGPAGYEKLTMMCHPTSNVLCLFFDDLGHYIGNQLAFDPKRFFNQVFDWHTSGFKDWTVDENGEKITYKTTSMFLASAKYLAKDVAIRAAERDETKILQDSQICVTGFYGNLVCIPSDATQLLSEGIFTLQGCMNAMGYHLYYHMTETLQCAADTILTYFVLVHDNQLVGIGFMIPGKYVIPTGQYDPCERPPKAFVKAIVPYGPPCLPEYGDSTNITTVHTYWVKEPYTIKCK